MFTCFVSDSDGFNHIRNWIYARERVKFEVDVVDFNLPRSDEVHCYCLPRKQSCWTRGKVTIASVALFVELASLGAPVDYFDARSLKVVCMKSCSDGVV